MHPTHAALLRAICESPADDLPRLALADWLEESGSDPDRAAFVRAQIALARMGGVEQNDGRPSGWFCQRSGTWTGWHRWAKRCRCELCSLRRREYETSKRFCVWDWCRGIPSCSVNVYQRGFVSGVTLPMQAWLDHGPAIVLVHPVTDVKLSDREPWFSGGNPDTAKWWGWHCESDDPDGLHPATLPGVLFALLPGGTTHYFDDDGACRRAYPSRQEAMDALSTAAVALARQKAGLLPLPE